MSKITPELQKLIEQEAENNTSDFRDNNDYQGGIIKGYMEGYEVAGEIYAEKWQEAEQRADRYEKALKEIQAKAKRGIFPHLPVETMGAQMCIEIDQYITDLLTPKQTNDDTANR